MNKRSIIMLAVCVVMGAFVAYEYGLFDSTSMEERESETQLPPPPQQVPVVEFQRQSDDPKPELSNDARNLIDKQHEVLIAGLDAKKAEFDKQKNLASIEVSKAQADITNEQTRLKMELANSTMSMNQEWDPRGSGVTTVQGEDRKSNQPPILNTVISSSEVVLTVDDNVGSMNIGERRSGYKLISIDRNNLSADFETAQGVKTLYVSTQSSRHFPVTISENETSSE